MSLYGAFDQTKHFDELDEPLDTQEGVLSPSVRRARAIANLFGGTADAGVTFTGPTGTAEDSGGQITLDTAETTIAVGDYLGLIDFIASSEASGDDAVLLAARIAAISEGTFAADNNATKLAFFTGASEAATEKMSLSSGGNLAVSGTITPAGGYKAAPVALPADDTTITLSASNSGKVHMIPDLDATSTATLPAAAEGLYYEFVYVGGAADAHDFVLVPTAGFYIGGLGHADVGGTTAAVYSDNNSNDVLTIVTPAAGTRFGVWSDGTNWYLGGTVFSATIPTLADS